MLTIIAATSENNALGKDNQLVWHLPDDFKRLKALTSGHFNIMGRKTFESFPKPLPNRTHIIITRQKDYKAPEGCFVVNNLTKAIALCPKNEEVFVIGGGEIYKQALEITNKIYLTKVDVDIDGDTFFHYNTQEWRICYEELIVKNEKNEYDSTYQELERI